MPSTDTKERILDAAERLFADKGFAATSLRTVIAEAGVNLAAAHYHFGSRVGLIRAVFARRLDPLNERRLGALTEFEAAAMPDGPSVDDILEAFIRPVAQFAVTGGDGGVSLGNLMGRAHMERGPELRTLLLDQFAEVLERFSLALRRALPHLSLEELYSRLHFVIGAMGATLSEPRMLEHLSGGRIPRPPGIDETVTRLIAFLAAGLRAPACETVGARREEPGSREGGVARGPQAGRDGGRHA